MFGIDDGNGPHEKSPEALDGLFPARVGQPGMEQPALQLFVIAPYFVMHDDPLPGAVHMIQANLDVSFKAVVVGAGQYLTNAVLADLELLEAGQIHRLDGVFAQPVGVHHVHQGVKFVPAQQRFPAGGGVIAVADQLVAAAGRKQRQQRGNHQKIAHGMGVPVCCWMAKAYLPQRFRAMTGGVET